MKFIIFLLSYTLGFSTIFIAEKYIILYFIVLGFYSSLFYYKEKEEYKKVVIEPLFLSMISALIVLILNKINIIGYGVFISAIPYLLIVLKGKSKNKNKINSDLLFIIERVILPLTLPITLCFVVSLLIKSDMIASISFILFYFIMINNMMKDVPSIGYSVVVLFIQNATMFYLYEYIYFIATFEKIILFVAVNTIIIINIYRRRSPFSIRSKFSLRKNTNIIKQ